MKRISIPATLLLAAAFACNNEDLGNYNYREIVEMTIDGIEDSYSVMMDVGFLDINPDVSLSDGGNPDDPRYAYSWISEKLLGRVDTIGRQRALHWQASLPIDLYTLRLRVVDRETGLLWKAATTFNVVSYHGRGLLLVGEDPTGKARVQFLAMLAGQDTLFYPDLLANSNLPDLRGPRDVFHTGNTGGSDTRRIWLLTDDGSYWIDRYSLRSSAENTLNSWMLTPRTPPLNVINMAPRVKQSNGDTGQNSQRFFITDDANLYANYVSIYGAIYEFPVNCLANDLFTYFPASPHLFYSLNSLSGVVWYDTRNERFLFYASPLNNNSVALVDDPADPFPWNQEGTGRTLLYGENTRDIEGSSPNGNSFAIMHSDAEDATYIYKFYANGNPPKKRACYAVIPEARGIDDARLRAFASNRPLLFFVAADGKLYCYDYNPGNESVYRVNTGNDDPITMLEFDREVNPTADHLYVATYNSAAGGTLTKYSINTIGQAALTPLPDFKKWAGQFVKIVNVSWRGSE